MADVILTIDDENYAISGDGVVYSISDKCALSNVFFSSSKLCNSYRLRCCTFMEKFFFPEMCNTSYLNAFFSSSKIKQRLYLIPPSCAFLAECGDCEAARDAAQVQPP